MGTFCDNPTRGMCGRALRRFAALFLAGFCACAAGAFERIALVDSYDFATHFDAETKTGNVQIVDHVLLTGADTVLWRNCSGALLRYRTQEEKTWSTEHPLEKLRLPASGAVYGWLRMDQAEPDIFRTAMETCAVRGKAKGVHWPFEETHWSSWTLGAWNLDHPQYWSVSRDGLPWYGRGSLVHPEVVAHKLRLLDELLARGADVVYIDLMRNGGWSPAWEYTPATRARWAAKFPNEEPPKDPQDERWLALVSEYQHAYLKVVRARLDREGRKVRLILGIDHAGRVGGEYNWVFRAIDWKKLAAEGVVDAISVMSVDLSAIDVKDPWTSTRRVYDDVKHACGQVPVYYPIMAYNFTGRPGYPEYMKWTKLSDAETVRKLLALARDAGGAGITMEVVDYRNYSPAVCREIRAFGASR